MSFKYLALVLKSPLFVQKQAEILISCYTKNPLEFHALEYVYMKFGTKNALVLDFHSSRHQELKNGN